MKKCKCDLCRKEFGLMDVWIGKVSDNDAFYEKGGDIVDRRTTIYFCMDCVNTFEDKDPGIWAVFDGKTYFGIKGNED